jgi:hypothetical protein
MFRGLAQICRSLVLQLCGVQFSFFTLTKHNVMLKLCSRKSSSSVSLVNTPNSQIEHHLDDYSHYTNLSRLFTFLVPKLSSEQVPGDLRERTDRWWPSEHRSGAKPLWSWQGGYSNFAKPTVVVSRRRVLKSSYGVR